ncbi:DUF1194 domain-containing protein [Mesorhizobium sp. M0816]|uniref:DUF1194 domain-containing protein n=1 Tax=Mesorhizobium sp. M0816 TaxID=2957006 RepID=UPI00333959E9
MADRFATNGSDDDAPQWIVRDLAANEACSPRSVAKNGTFAVNVNDAIRVNTEGLGSPIAVPAITTKLVRAAIRILIIRTTLVVPALFVPTSPQAQTAAPTVDLCLVLAADISASISSSTARMQREGHAQALTHSDVVSAIARTRTGRIAVTYIEWSSHGNAYTILPWRVIENARDAADAADVIRARGHNPGQYPLGLTSLSWAIIYATQTLAHCPATPDRTVIDISANGPNNDGPPPDTARDNAVAIGHTINAFAIPAPLQPLKDLALSLDPDEGTWQNPTDYLYTHVTGGANSFATTAHTLDDYSVALRRKIITEISGLSDVEKMHRTVASVAVE